MSFQFFGSLLNPQFFFQLNTGCCHSSFDRQTHPQTVVVVVVEATCFRCCNTDRTDCCKDRSAAVHWDPL